MAGASLRTLRNGASSSLSSESLDLSTIGRSKCESTCVSPCPGKCLTQHATRSLRAPRSHAAPRRATSSAFAEKLRSAITGLSGLLLTSSTGAKFQLKPVLRMPRATAAPTSCASDASPAAPSAIAAGGCGRKVARITAPPSWSRPISALDPITSRNSAVSARTSSSLPRLSRNSATARMRQRRRNVAWASSSVLPRIPTMTSWPGWSSSAAVDALIVT